MNWTTEMKIKLAKADDEERNNGGGFMKRVNERWDLEFPEQGSAEAVVQRCSVKKVFLKISQNSKEKTCARVSF